MKFKEIIFRDPKSPKAARNQAAYCLEQKEILKLRRINILKTKNQIEEKLTRLQKALQDLDSQINSLNTIDNRYDRRIEELKVNYQLTEAEILETKSELLRKKISSLQKQVGVNPTGNDQMF